MCYNPDMTEKDFSVADTLSSGQCFRFSEKDGLWTVICGVDEQVRTLSLRQGDYSLVENDCFFRNYFDFDTDYAEIKRVFSQISPVMEQACNHAPGIRILKQDSWEALCSFVVSQNNNIKRICGIIGRMCENWGKQGECGIHGFPSAETLCNLSEDSLRSAGLGFRAPYVINTARAVCNGDVDFDVLKTSDIDTCRRILMKVKGIGPKVADCALLFGCHRLDCFPLDVWMKRVMQKFFPEQTKEIFGQNAGVAQQYLFHWARTSGIFTGEHRS